MNYFLAETIGTLIMVLLGNGVVANINLNKTKGNGAGWLVIAAGWAFAVHMGGLVAASVSGAHLNPVISIALAMVGKFSWSLVPMYILAQTIGAMMGAFLVWLFYYSHFEKTEDDLVILSCFCTAPAIRNFLSNIFSEMLATFILVLIVLKLTEINFVELNGVKVGIASGVYGAIATTFLIFSIGLSLGGTTGYALNPARDIGPRIIHSLLNFKGGSDWYYSWVPVVGPVLGAICASAFYMLIS